MTKINTTSIDYFSVVIREGSITRAAKILNISQSALSQRLKTLEFSVGCPLWIQGRPIRPTAAGEAILRYQKKEQQLSSSLSTELENININYISHYKCLAIGTDYDSAGSWMSAAITSFQSEINEIEMICSDLYETPKLLSQGRVHGCTTHVEAAPIGFKSTQIGVTRYLAVASPSYFFAINSSEILNFSDTRVKFISLYRKDSITEKFIKTHLRISIGRVNRIYIPSSEGRLHALFNNMGISIVPEYMVQKFISKRVLVNVFPGKVFEIPVYWQCCDDNSDLTRKLTNTILVGAGAMASRSDFKERAELCVNSPQ